MCCCVFGCRRELETKVHSGLTTQAQRPGPRARTMATVMRWPGSLQRMVRPHRHRVTISIFFLGQGDLFSLDQNPGLVIGYAYDSNNQYTWSGQSAPN